MTAPAFITRRMLLKDMGKAGLAVMLLGTAACTSDSGNSTSTTQQGQMTTSPPPTNASTTERPGTTTTHGSDRAGYQWHRVNLDFVSAYILYRGGEAVIVDTGVGGSETDIEAGLTEVGLGWGDVGGLVVTHLHPDHQGSVPAVIGATSDSLPWFAGAGDLGGINAPTEGQAVGDGDVVAGGLQIIETPGHTPGHICVLDAASGLLLAGDALNGTDGSAVTGPNPQFTPDMATANASVGKLATFDYEVALFGHGEPLIGGASVAVADLAASLG